MPSVNPSVRNSHDIMVQRRTARSHESSRCPVIKAAIPNANGMVIPTNPV